MQEISVKGFLPETLAFQPHCVSYNFQEGIPEDCIDNILNPENSERNIIGIFGICTDEIVKEIYEYENEYVGHSTVHLHPFNCADKYNDP